MAIILYMENPDLSSQLSSGLSGMGGGWVLDICSSMFSDAGKGGGAIVVEPACGALNVGAVGARCSLTVGLGFGSSIGIILEGGATEGLSSAVAKRGDTLIKEQTKIGKTNHNHLIGPHSLNLCL